MLPGVSPQAGRAAALTDRSHPRVLEYKLYAKGVGMVLAIAVSGGSDREELVRMVPSPA
jgi:hypothetical protein